MTPSRVKTKYPNTLWRARKKAQLGQKQVAALLGLKSNTLISRYEHGKSVPTLEEALLLEDLYGVPLRQLYRTWSRELRERLYQRVSPIVYAKSTLLERLDAFQNSKMNTPHVTSNDNYE